jgi:hypothetical protein
MIALDMVYDCCGDADAEAEAPPRLTSSPNLARYLRGQVGETILS